MDMTAKLFCISCIFLTLLGSILASSALSYICNPSLGFYFHLFFFSLFKNGSASVGFTSFCHVCLSCQEVTVCRKQQNLPFLSETKLSNPLAAPVCFVNCLVKKFKARKVKKQTTAQSYHYAILHRDIFVASLHISC